jgi:PAS domain S-box-containing protein
MKHLLSTSPYPIFRVKRDGTIIYANEACSPLFHVWGISPGEKIPSKILFFIPKAALGKENQKSKIKENGREYLLNFESAGDGHINIYGFDLTLMRSEEKISNTEKTYDGEIQEPGKIGFLSSDLQTLLDKIAEMTASALQVESCRILKTSDTSDYTEGTCNGLHFQEIGSNRKNQILQKEFAYGISVFAKMNGINFTVITLQKNKPAEFVLENICYLRYVLSLVIKILELQESERKLKNKTYFLENLLQSISDPAYFRNICNRTEINGFIGREGDFLSKELTENPLFEVEKIIHEDFPSTVKEKKILVLNEDTGLTEAVQERNRLKKSEEALKIPPEVQKVLWSVINNSPAVVFLWRNEKNWPADFVSENISQFGYTVEDFTSGKYLYGSIIHREDIDRVRTKLDHYIRAGYEDFRIEYRIFTKDGKLCWVDERTFIQRNKVGEATYFQGVVIDITERKIAEEAFIKAEEMRKKEISHRIKNNLQIVSCLLDLQAEKFSDREVIEAFRESENRIQSMSLIHQELCESGKLDSLDFSSYLSKLIEDLTRVYDTENHKVLVTMNIRSIFLGVDTAVPLGIVINELFTNSLKYAFSEESCGKICISLLREKDKQEEDGNDISGETFSARTPYLKSSSPASRTYETLTLIFEDNGKGFPEEVDLKNPDTLGLQLVNTLVEQIEGSIDLERGRGTKFTIKFKGEIYEKS